MIPLLIPAALGLIGGYLSKEPVKYAKGGLIAPNGKPSNLTPEQWKLVRTPEFKAWFGDWEKSPNKYMLIDENGEPMVWWHTGGNWNELINGGIGGTGKLMFSPTSRSMAYGNEELHIHTTIRR